MTAQLTDEAIAFARAQTGVIELVGPKGYIHGWIFVGVPGGATHVSKRVERSARHAAAAGHPKAAATLHRAAKSLTPDAKGHVSEQAFNRAQTQLYNAEGHLTSRGYGGRGPIERVAPGAEPVLKRINQHHRDLEAIGREHHRQKLRALPARKFQTEQQRWNRPGQPQGTLGRDVSAVARQRRVTYQPGNAEATKAAARANVTSTGQTLGVFQSHIPSSGAYGHVIKQDKSGGARVTMAGTPGRYASDREGLAERATMLRANGFSVAHRGQGTPDEHLIVHNPEISRKHGVTTPKDSTGWSLGGEPNVSPETPKEAADRLLRIKREQGTAAAQQEFLRTAAGILGGRPSRRSAAPETPKERPLRIAGKRMTKSQTADFNSLSETGKDIYEEQRQEGVEHAEAFMNARRQTLGGPGENQVKLREPARLAPSKAPPGGMERTTYKGGKPTTKIYNAAQTKRIQAREHNAALRKMSDRALAIELDDTDTATDEAAHQRAVREFRRRYNSAPPVEMDPKTKKFTYAEGYKRYGYQPGGRRSPVAVSLESLKPGEYSRTGMARRTETGVDVTVGGAGAARVGITQAGPTRHYTDFDKAAQAINTGRHNSAGTEKGYVRGKHYGRLPSDRMTAQEKSHRKATRQRTGETVSQMDRRQQAEVDALTEAQKGRYSEAHTLQGKSHEEAMRIAKASPRRTADERGAQTARNLEARGTPVTPTVKGRSAQEARGRASQKRAAQAAEAKAVAERRPGLRGTGQHRGGVTPVEAQTTRMQQIRQLTDKQRRAYLRFRDSGMRHGAAYSRAKKV